MKEQDMSGHGEFPSPRDIQRRREIDHAAAAAQALKDVEAMLLRGANRMSVDWNEPVRQLVERTLVSAGWAARYSYGDQREPGITIFVSEPSGCRDSYPGR